VNIRKPILFLLAVFFAVISILLWRLRVAYIQKSPITLSFANTPSATPTPNPLSIQTLRSRTYDSPAPTFVSHILSTDSYTKDLVSYISDGLKIYAVLTVPLAAAPAGGWPIIILNHGYIPPKEYDNTAKYVAYIDTLARGGYVVFMPDYRGHGDSEGTASGGYYDPGYAIDVLNGISSVRKVSTVDPERLYLWGHSMGGNVAMRVRAVEPHIKATVIWAGVTGSFPMISKEFFGRPHTGAVPSEIRAHQTSGRSRIMELYGSPSASIPYWRDVDPMTTVADIHTPIQIHHGESDETVPLQVSVLFAEELKSAGVPHELFTYPGENHNINGPAFDQAMERTIEFFNASK